jgi:PAS domain S-box-containing protein
MFVICSSLSVASGICLALVQLTGQPYPGFRYWTIGVLGQGIGFTLFAYARMLPPLIPSVAGNLLYSLYPMFYSRGLRVFAGRKAPVFPLVLASVYDLFATYYFSAVHTSLNWRVASGQLVIMPFFIDAAWVVLRDPAFRYPVVRRWLASTFSLMILFGLTRVALMFTFEPNRTQIWGQSAIQVVYMPLLTALSFSAAMGVMVLNFLRATKDLREKERLLREDVAARTAVESALRESETRYRELVERSPESVIVHRKGIIVYANPAAAVMFGASGPSDLTGRVFLDLIHPNYHAEVIERRRNVQEQGIGGSLVEMVYLKIDGTPFEVETQSARIAFDGIPAVQIAAHDISQLKQAAAEKMEFERKLRETQKLESLGVLAGGIAHDFNNILTGILGNASLASLELDQGSPAANNIRAITEGSQRAADLCRQMLAYSGKGNFLIQNVSLNRLVHDTAHLLQVSISKDAELALDLKADLPAIKADATQMRQVIMNLVINASEAIGERRGLIRLSTGVQEVDRPLLSNPGVIAAPDCTEGPYAYLEVSDNGCGMSPATLSRIFDPFFTTKFAGRGLGLAAVLGIVRGHKGLLRIDSVLDKGTKFRLLFPVAQGDEDPVHPSGPPVLAWKGSGLVLVVDDEESVRQTAMKMLQKLGFEVELAPDGAEAVRRFRASPGRYTLVMMDLTMPHMDGRQAFLEMRAIRQDVRLVLMSGFNETEAVSRFSDREAAGFLPKPFGFGALSQLLRSILEAPSRAM